MRRRFPFFSLLLPLLCSVAAHQGLAYPFDEMEWILNHQDRSRYELYRNREATLRYQREESQAGDQGLSRSHSVSVTRFGGDSVTVNGEERLLFIRSNALYRPDVHLDLPPIEGHGYVPVESKQESESQIRMYMALKSVYERFFQEASRRSKFSRDFIQKLIEEDRALNTFQRIDLGITLSLYNRDPSHPENPEPRYATVVGIGHVGFFDGTPYPAPHTDPVPVQAKYPDLVLPRKPLELRRFAFDPNHDRQFSEHYPGHFKFFDGTHHPAVPVSDDGHRYEKFTFAQMKDIMARHLYQTRKLDRTLIIHTDRRGAQLFIRSLGKLTIVAAAPDVDVQRLARGGRAHLGLPSSNPSGLLSLQATGQTSRQVQVLRNPHSGTVEDEVVLSIPALEFYQSNVSREFRLEMCHRELLP